MKRLKLAVLAGSAALMLFMAVPLAFSQATPTLTGSAIFSVNIRAVPGTSSAGIGVLPPNEQVIALGRNGGNNWVQIERDDGSVGWVARWLLTFSGDTAVLPITATQEPPLAGEGGPFAALSPFNLNMRASPDPASPLVTVIPFGTQAETTGRTASSSWLRVRYEGKEGWVASWLAILSNDINALPVDTTVVPVTATAPSAATVTSTRTPGPTPAASPQPTLTLAPPALGTFTATAPFRVNVRSAPSSVNGSVLAVLPFSTPVPAIGRNVLNNWVQIEYGNTTGWVAGWLVVKSDDPLQLPITSDLNEFTPFTGVINGKTISNVSLRGGPSLTYAVQTTVAPGITFPLTGRTEDTSWIQGNYQGVQGWVASWLVVSNADLTNLPVAR